MAPVSSSALEGVIARAATEEGREEEEGLRERRRGVLGEVESGSGDGVVPVFRPAPGESNLRCCCFEAVAPVIPQRAAQHADEDVIYDDAAEEKAREALVRLWAREREGERESLTDAEALLDNFSKRRCGQSAFQPHPFFFHLLSRTLPRSLSLSLSLSLEISSARAPSLPFLWFLDREKSVRVWNLVTSTREKQNKTKTRPFFSLFLFHISFSLLFLSSSSSSRHLPPSLSIKMVLFFFFYFFPTKKEEGPRKKCYKKKEKEEEE